MRDRRKQAPKSQQEGPSSRRKERVMTSDSDEAFVDAFVDALRDILQDERARAA
jgi:hypothetical protein